MASIMKSLPKSSTSMFSLHKLIHKNICIHIYIYVHIYYIHMKALHDMLAGVAHSRSGGFVTLLFGQQRPFSPSSGLRSSVEVCIRTLGHTKVCIHVMHMCIYVWVCVYMIYIYTYIHTYLCVSVYVVRICALRMWIRGRRHATPQLTVAPHACAFGICMAACMYR